MGHLAGKDIFHKLEDKIDSLPYRVVKNKAFYEILKELYTAEEAELIVKMPFSLSPADQIEKASGIEGGKLNSLLESLCSKGLAVDLWIDERYYYMPSPLVVGFLELTMMRTGNNLNSKKWAELFYEYHNNTDYYAVNFGNGQQIAPLRVLPHEAAIPGSDYTQVLDYESAISIVNSNKKFTIGLCSCRHEKMHLGEKNCEVPLESCISLGYITDYMIRHKFAKEVSKTEIIESLARSKEMGLVFSCDNVRNNVSFLCQCCSCCCGVLAGISKFGYPNTIVTSSFIADNNDDTCEGCGRCAKACPIGAIKMVSLKNPERERKKMPKINAEICIGCGVCSLKCSKTRSMKLIKRERRVIHPETNFERIILQSLERGTLQHQIFGNPEKITQKFMKGFIGGFLKLPPVKKALMSDRLRSSFLDIMKKGVLNQNKEYLLRI